MHGLDEGEIVGRVDGQPAGGARQFGIGPRPRDLHEIGMQLEVAGDVLARDRIVGRIHHQLVQGAPRHRIDAFVRGDRAVFEQDVIAALVDHRRQQMVDERRVDEGRIGGHADDDVGVQKLGGARETGENVVFRSADDANAMRPAEFGDGVVQRIGAGGDCDLFDQARFLEAMHDVPQQRLAGDRFQHFSWQARRTHPRLDHRDDALCARSCGRLPERADVAQRAHAVMRDRRASRDRQARRAAVP